MAINLGASNQDYERQKFVESPNRPGLAIPEVSIANTSGNLATESKQDDIISALTTLQTYTDSLEALLTFINSNTDGLEGFVDGLEGLLDTSNTILSNINTNVDGLEGFVDGVEGLIGTSNTLLTNIQGFVDTLETNTDGIESLLTLLNSYVDQLEGYLDGVEALITTTNTTLSTGIATMLDKTASGSLTALNDTLEIATHGCGTVGIQITGTWVGRIQFQGTNNNTDWFSVTFLPRSGAAAIASSTTGNLTGEIPCAGLLKVRLLRDIATSGTATVNMSAGSGDASVYVYSQNANNLLATATCIGNVADGATDSGTPVKVASVYNSTAPTYTNGQRANLQSNTRGSIFVTDEGRVNTYSTTSVFTFSSTPTDIFTITGSSTKTIKIQSITLQGSQTTENNRDVLLIKRSTANTGGTSTTLTNVPHDSANAAATATILAYTANPTLGTAVGTFFTKKVFIGDSSKPSALNELIFTDSYYTHGQSITLRGTNEVMALNMNGVTSSGNSVAISITWTEE